MRLITFYVPEQYLRLLDELCPYFYPNRAEAIRMAIRDLLRLHNILYVESSTQTPRE
jgi:Arc/MetJ-type ribon-helix-helix transcriptional regulator